MKDALRPITILLAEDDSNDCVLVLQALQELHLACDFFSVKDGVELMQYLHKEGEYHDSTTPRPDLILLDLNMPRMDGRQALAEIKSDLNLRSIPVVVISNSSLREDVMLTYDLGGAGFIVKPQTLEDMLEVVNILNQYWFEVVELANGEYVRRAAHHSVGFTYE